MSSHLPDPNTLALSIARALPPIASTTVTTGWSDGCYNGTYGGHDQLPRASSGSQRTHTMTMTSGLPQLVAQVEYLWPVGCDCDGMERQGFESLSSTQPNVGIPQVRVRCNHVLGDKVRDTTPLPPARADEMVPTCRNALPLTTRSIGAGQIGDWRDGGVW